MTVSPNLVAIVIAGTLVSLFIYAIIAGAVDQLFSKHEWFRSAALPDEVAWLWPLILPGIIIYGLFRALAYFFDIPRKYLARRAAKKSDFPSAKVL